MKVSIIVLVVLGLMAAMGAALLAASLHARPGGTIIAGGPPESQVVVAAKPLEANELVQADAVTVRRVPASQVPRGWLADPALAIGKSLKLPLVQGQAFTAGSFIADESPRNMANRMLTPGQRAKTVSLASDAALEGLLYPGCMVDVLWSFKGDSAKEQSLSKTLLENVPVLAIDRHTILSEDADAVEGPHGSTKLLVTLLLDPKQAATLQLAMDHGSICLALRNPTDTVPVAAQPVSLSGLVGDYMPKLASWNGGTWAEALRDLSKTVGTHRTETREAAAPATQPVAGREWQTVVIRGSKVQVERFPEAEAEADARS